MSFDRQPAQPGHLPQARGASGHRQSHFARADRAARGFQRGDVCARADDPGYLAILNDINATAIRAACIAPGHRVMACGSGAFMHRRP